QLACAPMSRNEATFIPCAVARIPLWRTGLAACKPGGRARPPRPLRRLRHTRTIVSCPSVSGKRGLRSREACDRHAVRRAGHVVQAEPMEELHRLGFSAMLTANPHLEAGPHPAPLLHGHRDQLAHALLVEH